MFEVAENLERIVKYLTEVIGVRLAGSKSEILAAEYLRTEGMKHVTKCNIEEFSLSERCVDKEKLEIFFNDKWHEYPCSLFSGAPSTKSIPVEAEIVVFDSETGYLRPDLSLLSGKAVIHLGCHIDSPLKYKRLMDAKPAFILFVDTRYTGSVQLGDGLFPYYIKEMGAVPSTNVAYTHVWEWHQKKATMARLTVTATMNNSLSTNVVIEIPGTNSKVGIIFAGGHHDTQAGTVGADDNACGSAIIIELARILSKKTHKRTFRLISFGGEEQLAAGSASYVRTHRKEIEAKGTFMFNFDSCGSAIGWDIMLLNASEKLEKKLESIFHNHDIYYKADYTVSPFIDQFPFAVAGVPGCWWSRNNCYSGRFYHHRQDNTIDKIDFEKLALRVNAASEFLSFLANQDDFTDYKGVPDSMKSQVQNLWNQVYGGWNNNTGEG